jgi:hypothetical protein
MPMRPIHLRGLLLALLAVFPATAQEVPVTGSLQLFGRFNSGAKVERLTRKRFYLVPGSLQDNKALIDRIHATEVESRDCYYSRVQASPQLICWLQAENCESPFCRKVVMQDVESVPEFKAAYDKGLPLFGKKPNIAQDWLASNLPPVFANGYYREKDTLLKKLLGDLKPVQSAMTSTEGELNYLDMPLTIPSGKKGQTFTVSNILPVELGGKSYVWSCQVDVVPNKPNKLIIPDINKPRKTCDVVVKDLTVCKAGGCDQK